MLGKWCEMLIFRMAGGGGYCVCQEKTVNLQANFSDWQLNTSVSNPLGTLLLPEIRSGSEP